VGGVFKVGVMIRGAIASSKERMPIFFRSAINGPI